jgi:hypothetical protein
MLNSPIYVFNLAVKRAKYNTGRVMKEAGLGKWNTL